MYTNFHFMRKFYHILFVLTFLLGITAKAQTKIYIAFLWHMHQPIYWPGESVINTINQNRYPFSISNVFSSRTGPYTNWPRDAVQMGINANMPHFGSQVSFSGSLIENLNHLEQANWGFQNWKSHWNISKNQLTSLGNPRMDMVGFGYYHPLMPLTSYNDIRDQIARHKAIMATQLPGIYSKGIFTPENAFSNHIIPALKDEGLEWVLVDNIHFDRACVGYPFNTGGNIYEMNKSDQINPNPNDWVQLNGLWAPTQNSAAWGRRPHYAQYTNPETGQTQKIIVVPADRYLGNEDGRGGFGALNYQQVLSQLIPFNTNPNHPILVVLHHDGDNYGGGTSSYYQNNFQNFVNWLQANGNQYECTTIQDYLQRFPPDTNDIIHVEPGSWSGADNGDPEYKKWNYDYVNCYSPDRNSWAIITAAKNHVETAEQRNGNTTQVVQAKKAIQEAMASDYWYWDGSLNGIWDSHSARGANLALNTLGNQTGIDQTPPTIWLPQRAPYNPGMNMWNQLQPSDFTVWTYAYDLSGLAKVKLKFRTDLDGQNPIASIQNETYLGGNEVSAWDSIDMTPVLIPSQTNPLPQLIAQQYYATIRGLGNVLVDYYIEATDSLGNISKSIIQHVWVGPANNLFHTWINCGNPGGGGGGGGISNGVSWTPLQPTQNDTITITYGNPPTSGKLHWGVNGWQLANNNYRPNGSFLFNNTGPAVQSPMTGPSANQTHLSIKLGPFNNPAQLVTRINFVINFDNNSWDNNNGQDYEIPISLSTGIKNISMGTQIFPNPVSNELWLTISNIGNHAISLVDLQGKILQKKQINAAGEHALHQWVSELKPGVYVVKVENKNENKNFKFVKI